MDIIKFELYDRVIIKDTRSGKIFRALITGFGEGTFQIDWVTKDFDFKDIKDTLVDRHESFDVVTGRALGNPMLEYVGKP